MDKIDGSDGLVVRYYAQRGVRLALCCLLAVGLWGEINLLRGQERTAAESLQAQFSGDLQGLDVGIGSLGTPRPDIAVAVGHTCVLHFEGLLYCWGSNLSGELGLWRNLELVCDAKIGNKLSRDRICALPEPVISVSLAAAAHQVVVGTAHTCALLKDGRVQCWGDNSLGALGLLKRAKGCRKENGSFFCSIPPPPLQLSGKVRQLAAAGSHTCALLTDGKVQCWGSNEHGQIGFRPSATRLPGKTVPLPLPAKQIEVGSNFSCALLKNETVHCWGDNQFGQLGRQSNAKNGLPAAIHWKPRIQKLITGTQHACIISTRQALYCWGDNSKGALGLGALPPKACSRNLDICNRPTQAAASATPVTAAAAGTEHTCALSQGKVECWGANDAGQLGIRHTVNTNRATRTVNLKVSITDIAASYHTCALSATKEVFCWGENSSGQLGLGAKAAAFIPYPSRPVYFP